MSLNETRKDVQIAGKGHNEILEIVNPVVETTTANAVTGTHVPGNRDARDILNFAQNIPNDVH
jgi:metal-dependent hydrolase (beta-lactamase superfamily II)